MNPPPTSRMLSFLKPCIKNLDIVIWFPRLLTILSKAFDVDNIQYDLDYKIKFNNIVFRHIDEIEANDIESAVSPKFKDRFRK